MITNDKIRNIWVKGTLLRTKLIFVNIMKNLLIFSALTILLFSCKVDAQNNDPYVGTFVDQQQSTAIVLNAVNNGYQGVIASGNMSFTLTAQRVGNQLQGQIISGMGTNLPWSAQIQGDQLHIYASGMSTVYYRMANNGQLTGRQNTTNNTQPYAGQQQNPYSQNPSNSGNSGRSNLSNSREAQKIAGSRLYWHRKASVLSSAGGAYGEIDFCPNGMFLDYSEASMSVEGGTYDYNTGDHAAWAGVAGNQRSSGRWTITNSQGQQALVLQYNNGNTATYYLNNVMSGSWYIGRVKYAMDWGKGQCR